MTRRTWKSRRGVFGDMEGGGDFRIYWLAEKWSLRL
jgi:hypothetical protein